MGKSALLTDFELLSQLREGKQDAYAEIYDRFQGLLYIYACKIIKDFDEAEDIVQEVFISLWDKRSTLTIQTSLSAYLYTAVRYKFMNLLAHQKVRTDYSASLQQFINKGEFQTDNYIREKEFSAEIEKEINLLPEKMREIFILSRKQHQSNKEIAEQLNVSQKTVRNQLGNALKILRIKLGLVTFIMLWLFY